MDYNKIYFLLVERAKHRQIDGYGEMHHILPKCLGGNDDHDNLVKLTPEEHYLAHQLLVKMHPNNSKLARAAAMMIPNRRNNKMYGWLRRRFSIAQSESQSGNGNSQYGTVWITDGISAKKIPKDEIIPCGWKLGRTLKKENNKVAKVPYFNSIKMCKDCLAELNKQKAYFWYTKLINSNSVSIREFVKNSEYDKSHVSFIKMLKSYVKEFSTEKGKRYVPS